MSFVPLKTPPGVLGEIVARTEDDLRARMHRALPKRMDSVRNFVRALAPDVGVETRPRPYPRLIAEFKPKSPSAGTLRTGPLEVETFAELYAPYASAMSVLTDGPYFGGDVQLLARARAKFPGPVLRKDFVISRFQVDEAYAYGADAILLMASLLPLASLAELLDHTAHCGLAALVEVHDHDELSCAIEANATVIGVNSRDLVTLEIDLGRAADLLERVPTDKVVVAESGLHTRGDLNRLPAHVDAVLIGTAFMRADNPQEAISDMGFTPCR